MIRCVPLLLLMVAGGSAIPFEDCGSQYDLRDVVIEECPRAPCGIYVAQYLNVTTHFVAGFSSERLENDAFFFVSNIEIDAVINKYKCPMSNSSCVEVSGEVEEYMAEVYVNEDLPPATGQLVWRIYNENKIMVMCFKISVRINP